MSLSWNEIRTRAIAFSKNWDGESSERAESQSFWNDFFQVFDIERRRVATFEKSVKLTRNGEIKNGRIDAFWKGVLLIEHKSEGADLDRAFDQAADYFEGLQERDLPRYILVSDFRHFRLFDLDANDEIHFKLGELHKHVKRFGFIAGYKAQEIKPQDPVNIKAAEKMGRLHDLLKDSGYQGHQLEVLLVRLLFCLFADDTGIFQSQIFRGLLEERTREDGADLGPLLAQLFQVLDTPEGKRQKALDEAINAFPYVNGRLFEERLDLATFDSSMRDALLDCCALDWSAISPAIFGALFQSIMDDKARRNLGAHYTSEENILKLIKPLFLDDLWSEFHKVKGNKNKLFEFHKKLRQLTFLDPACGCGNFLVISYRELRLLELEVLRAVHDGPGSRFLDIHSEIQINVDQFHGIEIEEFPAQIAQVAMWLIDHQMNMRVSEEFGMYFARIPLTSSPHIVHANALQVDWNAVLPAERCDYVMGNPPFVGAMVMSTSQRADFARVMSPVHGFGVLDLVTAWYVLSSSYLANSRTEAAFVSTSSICQGEQVGILWSFLLQKGLRINFAHQIFKWQNEARGVAALDCVIIGFAKFDRPTKTIFSYESSDSIALVNQATNISPYLVDAPDVLLANRDTPIGAVPAMAYGNMPRDDGNLLLSDEDYRALVAKDPDLARFIRPFISAKEFLNGQRRWCFWLIGAKPNELRMHPDLVARLDAVRKFRQESKAASTRKFAEFPGLFCQIAQPDASYLLVPRHSSENRKLIPMGFFDAQSIVADSCLFVGGATLFEFGVMQSEMHSAWVRYTCGRLERRFRYSKDIVYNNFPWPDSPSDAARKRIESAAQGVLDARAEFPDSTLADLYDPLSMPPELVKAHQKLDAAVDAAYGRKSFRNDAERVAFLFELYQKYTSILPSDTASKPKRSRKQ